MENEPINEEENEDLHEHLVENKKKAHAMANAENRQRDREKRRERAGMSVDLKKRDEAAEAAGENWEAKEELSNELMEKHIINIEGAIDRAAEGKLGLIDLPIELYTNPEAFEKLKDYLGAERSNGDEHSEVYTTEHSTLIIIVTKGENPRISLKVI